MFGSLLSALRPNRFPEVAPDAPMAVIGDVHGRADLLEKLLGQIGTDRALFCVGDYVDRGDRSADVLALLQERPDITCLRGNHEEMLLAFLEDPDSTGPRWLRYGGLQTLASFGIRGLSDTSRGADLIQARDRLRVAMGDAMIAWLGDMPLWHLSGNVAVTHAGADPHCPIDEQSAGRLLWGHPDFFKSARRDGVWVVHGHTIVDAASARSGRISVDTGAYATGRLTAALIGPDGVEFISA